jgi:small GTP-binding protein
MAEGAPRQRKICMLGAFAVGKTSLVRRYVEGIFSEKYLTTIGVKIDRKSVSVEGRRLDLILWDLNGEDDFLKVKVSYLRGAAGYLLVADGTRLESLETAFQLQARAEEAVGSVPFVIVLNKLDLARDWEISPNDLAGRLRPGCPAIRTSAKTGAGVEESFFTLAQLILED